MTLIIIIIDGKQHCSFDGDVSHWRQERFFKVSNPTLQTSITNTIDHTAIIRTKQLRIFCNSHSELDDVLALFCYDMVNPTRQRIGDDIHHYEVEQYRNKLLRRK